MATQHEDMRSDESIERAMAEFRWDLDGLDRKLKHKGFGELTTPKAIYVAEYIERKRRGEGARAVADAHALNKRMTEATEESARQAKVSADAAESSKRIAFFSAIVAFFASLASIGAWVVELGKR